MSASVCGVPKTAIPVLAISRRVGYAPHFGRIVHYGCCSKVDIECIDSMSLKIERSAFRRFGIRPALAVSAFQWSPSALRL